MIKMNEKNKLTDKEKEILLIEYQKTQDSAEHHDRLAWTVSSIFFAGMFVLMSNLLRPNVSKILVLAISLVFILLSIILLAFFFSFNDLKNQKYRKCKEIEIKLGIKYGNHSKIAYNAGFMRTLYLLIIMFVVVMWVIICVLNFL